VLKQRLITSLILIPLFVGAVLFLPAKIFISLVFAVTLAAAWEWSRLAGMNNLFPKVIYVLLLALCMAVLWLFIENTALQYAILSITLAWWVYNLVLISCKRADIHGHGLGGLQPAVMGAVALVPTWFAIAILRYDPAYNNQYLLFLFVLIWIADIAAYAAGKTWGRRKLSPQISPGKTWEGVFGAVLATFIAAVAGALYFDFRGGRIIGFILICLLCLVFSIIGDLVESIMKRQKGVKDSGAVLPGHGGVLDRIDSLTAASSVYVMGLLLLGQKLD
jgi:phosphatidate cytidylyltransferase